MSQVETTGSSRPTSTVSRRGALALGVAASAMALGARSASADSIRTGGGIAGGGWATWEAGEAQFSVFGSRFAAEEREEPLVFGGFRWADASGLTLTSEAITGYGPVEPTETARELAGYVRNSDGDTLHPFSLTLVEAGGPGEGLDRLTLAVGPAIDTGLSAGATPAAAGVEIADGTAAILIDAAIEVGDLQLLTFEFPE